MVRSPIVVMRAWKLYRWYADPRSGSNPQGQAPRNISIGRCLVKSDGCWVLCDADATIWNLRESMATSILRVGIIGITPGRSWAAVAHVPALHALEGFMVSALCTTNLASARAPGESCGVARAYAMASQLINDPEVDVVVVTVKVPHHFELVQQAIQAGKPVFCEWPLGSGLAEAEQLTRLAQGARLPTAVGLQARTSPVIRFVQELVASGEIGEVLSTTLTGSGMNWGEAVNQVNAYTADRSTGASMLTIPVGHALDALQFCVGDVASVSAVLLNRRHVMQVIETGALIPMTAQDQVLVSGELVSGAALSVHYRGGRSRGTNLLWEINGTRGDLQLTSLGGHLQIFDLTLRGGFGADTELRELQIPDRHRLAPARLQGPAASVAGLYLQFADAIHGSPSECASFLDGLNNHRLGAAIERAARTGQSQTLPPRERNHV